jgi:cytoskeletal protein RodZ
VTLAQPVLAAQPIAEGAELAWDFEGEKKVRSRRRRKGGMPRWVRGAAAVIVATSIVLGTLFALGFWQERENREDKTRTIQQKAKKPSQRPNKSPEKRTPKSEEPETALPQVDGKRTGA